MDPTELKDPGPTEAVPTFSGPQFGVSQTYDALKAENAKLRHELAEAKGELESINRRIAHLCSTL